VLLLLVVRVISTDDLDLFSSDRSEPRDPLRGHRHDRGKLQDDLQSIFPSLVQSSGDREKSSHVLKKSAPVLKESSPSGFQLSSARSGVAAVTE
jgi:hypothetical protein